jgi:NADPH:quinone reductase-like Zn-dependent oxidoreductase
VFRKGDGMKAIVQDEYGSANVLRFEDVETPVAGRGEVLIHVIAASAFIGDWHVMTGTPYAIRLVSGLRTPKQRVRGQDVAGEIEAVGDDVTAFRPGDEVFGIGNGTFAEYATARPDKIAPKPANLGYEEAATVPTTGCTALQGIRDVGKVRSGQRVLVIGTAGGVGSFSVQIAKAFGAQVTGVFEGRPRPVDRRGRGHRLHEGGHHRWDSPLRSHLRHCGQPPRLTAPASPDSEGDTRPRRR